MAKETCSREEFKKFFTEMGPTKTAAHLKISTRAVLARRRDIEHAEGIELKAPPKQIHPGTPRPSVRRQEELENGVIIVGSDCHYWPNEVTTAHLAFVDLCEKLNPDIVVMDGDVFDGARASRHPPLGWEHTPTILQEFEVCQERLGEIHVASPDAKHYWLLGNHDARYEMRLAKEVPEFEGLPGLHLKDHFSDWIHGDSLWVNFSPESPHKTVAIMHNWKGGVHADFNNTKDSGVNFVTGHTHKQGVAQYQDFTGLRYGIELGTMAEPYSDQFLYSGDRPRNHTSGFAVLTILDGRLIDPEFVKIPEPGMYLFRGEKHDVSSHA